MKTSSAFEENEDEDEFKDDQGNDGEEGGRHPQIEARRVTPSSPPIVFELELDLVLDPIVEFRFHLHVAPVGCS